MMDIFYAVALFSAQAALDLLICLGYNKND